MQTRKSILATVAAGLKRAALAALCLFCNSTLLTEWACDADDD